MAEKEYLPIKVVIPRKEDYEKPHGGGGGAKIFCVVTNEIRDKLADQVLSVREQFAASFKKFPGVPAVARVVMKPLAEAKSHRPDSLFNEKTCPVIGAGNLGELFVSVSPQGLDSVAKEIVQSKTEKVEANISAVSNIQAWGRAEVMGEKKAVELGEACKNTKSRALKIRLFNHNSLEKNTRVIKAFKGLLDTNQIEKLAEVRYFEGSSVYRLDITSEAVIKALSNFVGIKSLSPFQDYRVIKTASTVIGAISHHDFPKPRSDGAHGLVGIIDSGTDPNNKTLQAWIHDRFDFVPLSMQDNEHGSFVAGLLAHSRRLNHGDKRFPSASAKVIDFVALDKDGSIDEFDLLTAIDTAISEFPDVRVWNLSLGLDDCCHEFEFSDLAAALDERSKQHNVLFVLAAGNYGSWPEVPYRSWRPDGSIGEHDRICPPADSIRGITVGSLAHVHNNSSLVKTEEPSPFSRRGFGPAYSLKPELTHYGGNCDRLGNYHQSGVVSFNGNGQLAESIGTSFSTPLVSTIASNVWQELAVTPDAASPLLVKALLVHSAFISRLPLDAEEVKYFGLGCPKDANEIINCSQSSATIIIQTQVFQSADFGKRPFPMPSCLSANGKTLQAEIFMTLLHDTPVDKNYGMEYCRSNLKASLGTTMIDQKTGEEEYRREVNPIPKVTTEGFKAELIKNGYKWSPLKLYYRRLMRGPAEKQWRLSYDLVHRKELLDQSQQDAVLLITIRDPLGKAKVYDELVQEMNRLGWGAQDLQIRSRQRLQN